MGSFLLKEPSMFLTYMGLSIFFNLNPCFLANSKLITSPIAPLSNNASTVISSCVSILSKPIFTVISLNVSFLFVFFTSTSFSFLSCPLLSFLFFIFLFLSFSLIPSVFDAPTFISLASTLNLLLESS